MKKCFCIILFTILLCSAPVYGDTYSAETTEKSGSKLLPVINSGDLSIHFLELGNKYTGDCVYINYNKIDILIDAGSKQASASTIKAYIDNYIQDTKIEYVIATHAHEDHIAGFYSTKTVTGILDAYEIGMIIDFPKTNSVTAVYRNYREARDKTVNKGTVHYNALQCYNNEAGAQRIYNLGDEIKLEILYNYYYENNAKNENDYSVCVRIIQNEKQYLFTGDLEGEGEDRLVDYYEENHGGLGHCILYKGGHHGSNTSSGEKLMAAIWPEYICVCSCVGSPQYRASPNNVFPSQGFIDRVSPYTDRIYITTIVTDYSNNEYLPFNGNIIFIVSPGAARIIFSGNDYKLKDSPWFTHNRLMPEAWVNSSFP